MFLLLFFFIFRKKLVAKKRKGTISKLRSQINMSVIERMASTLTRVNMIAENNKKFYSISKRLSIQFDELELKLKATVMLVNNLAIKSKVMPSNEFNEHKTKIELSIESVNSKVKQFNIDAHSIIQQDDFMRSELTFLQSHLREVIEVYKTKRISLRNLSDEIDTLIKEIKLLEKNFEDSLDKGDSNSMSDDLAELSKKIILFARVINEGPAIQSYLLVTIPSKTTKLLKMYKEKKKELNTNFNNIDFHNSFDAIRNKYLSAKNYFKNLSIDKAELKVREILKSLKVLEKMINNEIESRNLFFENFNGTISQIQSSLRSYVVLKKKYDLINKKVVTPELQDDLITLKNNANNLNASAITFKKLATNNDISFSSKISRMKIILGESVSFITKMNAVENSIWNLNSKDILLENKFLRTMEALESLIAEVKKKRIKLKEKHSNLLKSINDEAYDVRKIIEKGSVNTEDQKQINELIKRISDFYIVVSGNIQMATLASDLIKRLSRDRSSNESLGFALTTAENEYLSGRYDSALNAIIAWMEME